jgi:hypothetical protein
MTYQEKDIAGNRQTHTDSDFRDGLFAQQVIILPTLNEKEPILLGNSPYPPRSKALL